ncbi:MAG: TonB-dependent receptor plug domain-containing protein [Bacteroidales bacterium]|nr:TonB-dependent receptor plug domain-containing protein [Bacteroidales bacterium]
MRLKHFCAFILLFVSALWASAQMREVKGTVLDEEGDPIVGATVTVTGTDMRVATDISGKFIFPKLDQKYKSVTVTYVGMEPAEAKISPDMIITMHSHSEMMDEVVVVAFGKQKREAFTGSAAVIKGDDIIKRQSNNPISALEGKVPGMTMLQSNNPTEENTINIRGLSSINAKTSPLIILDGQPYEGSWRDINPADVDNISVLKDAASNALYGARGANGVIMITTKSPSKGKTKVTVDVKWGCQHRCPDRLQHHRQYRRILRGSLLGSAQLLSAQPGLQRLSRPRGGQHHNAGHRHRCRRPWLHCIYSAQRPSLDWQQWQAQSQCHPRSSRL